MISRPCDHCGLVKRVRLVRDAGGRLAYLCRPCLRVLGYPPNAAIDARERRQGIYPEFGIDSRSARSRLARMRVPAATPP
jgi:hypothetical protein